MKSWFRQSPTGGADIIVELNFWDMVRLLFGREILAYGTVLRFATAYQAFNLEAPPIAPTDEPMEHSPGSGGHVFKTGRRKP